MNTSGTYKRLYDIGSLPDSLVKKKFMGLSEGGDWYDENTNDNFRRETLAFTGCDKPLFEHELPRKENPHRNMMLQLHATGSVYDHEPYHPELFLGEMSKDPRGVENNPNVREVADHARFRQKRYLEGKLQDDPDMRTEGVAPSRAIDRAVNGGYANTATRLTNLFDDSIDGVVRRSNPNPGRTIQRVGDNLKEDQKFHQSQSEKIIPKMGYNPMSLLTNQIGVNWDVLPEAKFGLSSVSNTYRSKNIVDASANAVFRMGIQDNRFTESQIPFTSSVMAQAKDAIKKDKQIQMSAEVNLKSDSRKNNFINRISHPTKAPGSKAMRSSYFTQKNGFQSTHVQTRLNPQNGNNQVRLGVCEPLKLVKQAFGDHNKMSIPKKDHLKIIRSIKRDGKQNHTGSERFVTRYNTNTKALSKAFTHRVDQYREKNGKNNAEVKQETEHYKQAGVHRPEDRISNIRTTKTKFHSATERLIANPIGQKQKNTSVNVGNYEFDTDPTTDNAFMTRRNSAQKMGYIFNERIYDNDISPLSEVINTRKYISAPDKT